MKRIEKGVVFGLIDNRLLISIEIGKSESLVVWVENFGKNRLVALFHLRYG